MNPSRLEARHRVAVLLREARKDAGLTQQHMADHLDVGRRTVLGWERGEAEPPTSVAVDWLTMCGKQASALDDVAARPLGPVGPPTDPNEWWVYDDRETLKDVSSRCAFPGAQPMLPGFDGTTWIGASPKVVVSGGGTPQSYELVAA